MNKNFLTFHNIRIDQNPLNLYISMHSEVVGCTSQYHYYQYQYYYYITITSTIISTIRPITSHYQYRTVPLFENESK